MGPVVAGKAAQAMLSAAYLSGVYTASPRKSTPKEIEISD
jgi:hypothetical protein